MTQTTHISQQFFSSQEVAEIVGAVSNLFTEQLKTRDQELAEIRLLMSQIAAQGKQTAVQVADLHRVKFTPIAQLAEKEDIDAKLTEEILSIRPRNNRRSA